MLPLGLPFGLASLADADFLVLEFPFAYVDIFGCFEPLELRGGIVLVAMGGGLVVGIAGGGLLNGVVELDGDGGLPTEGRTCVPDDTVLFSRGFRNMWLPMSSSTLTKVVDDAQCGGGVGRVRTRRLLSRRCQDKTSIKETFIITTHRDITWGNNT